MKYDCDVERRRNSVRPYQTTERDVPPVSDFFSLFALLHAFCGTLLLDCDASVASDNEVVICMQGRRVAERSFHCAVKRARHDRF